MREPKVGDRIRVHPARKYWVYHPHTPLWMENSYGTIIKLNRQTVTVVLDIYPEEKHRIDYGVFDILDEEVAV